MLRVLRVAEGGGKRAVSVKRDGELVYMEKMETGRFTSLVNSRKVINNTLKRAIKCNAQKDERNGEIDRYLYIGDSLKFRRLETDRGRISYLTL
jgi:hypothetical protein